MSCSSIRKYIFAFADGQLGVKENCEVLDHLKMCPACSRLVDEHQQLRAALGRVIGSAEAPAALRARVEAMTRGILPAARRPGRWPGYQTPLAIAAAVVLCAAGWLLIPDGEPPADTGPGPVRIAQGPPGGPPMADRARRAAGMVADLHAACCDMGLEHHQPRFPRGLDGLAGAIDGALGRKVATLAPDLTAHGYRFESANLCPARSDQEDCNGGHIIYRGEDASRLSFYSVPRWECLGAEGAAAGRWCRHSVPREGGKPVNILAWHRDRTTYICCGEAPMDRLQAMIEPVRTAMARFDTELRLALSRRAR